MEHAGFLNRSLAFIVDMIVFAVLGVLLSFPVGWFVSEYPDYSFLGWLYWLYHPILFVFCWIQWQATPGKILFKMKVMDADTGDPASFGQYVGRYFTLGLSFMCFGLGVLWVAVDSRKQGWHDTIVNTMVVQES